MRATLLSLAAILVGASAFATDYTQFEGKYTARYRYDSGGGFGRFITKIEATQYGLVMTLTSGWNRSINGNSYEFDCAENECVSAFSEISCEVNLKLLPSGNFIYSCRDSSYLFTPYVSQPPRSGKWTTKQSVDRSGVLSVKATVENKKQEASLALECVAPSSEMSMVLKVNQTLWRAISYSVESKQETLNIEMTARKRSKYSITDWTLDSQGNALLRVSKVSSNEIRDLKLGSVVALKITGVAVSGETTDLGRLKFTLKGSSNALSELETKCAATPQNQQP